MLMLAHLRSRTFATFSAVFLTLMILSGLLLHEVVFDRCEGTGPALQCSPVRFNAMTITSAELLAMDESVMGDLVSYVKMGAAWQSLQPLDEPMRWRFKNWPPVVPVLTAISMTFEPFLPLGTAKMLLSCALLAWIFLRLQVSLHPLIAARVKNPWLSQGLSLVTPFLLLILPDLRDLLIGRGILLSESLGILFFWLGLTALLRLILTNERTEVWLCAAAWGLSALTRAQLDITILLAVLVTICGLIFIRGYQTLTWAKSRIPHPKHLILALVLFFGLTSTWKLRNLIEEKNFSMITTSGSVYELLWTETDKLPYWMPNINTACQLRPELCHQINRAGYVANDAKKYLSWGVLIKQFGAWLGSRAKIWREFLIPNPVLRATPNFSYLAWGPQATQVPAWGMIELSTGVGAWLVLLLVLAFTPEAQKLAVEKRAAIVLFMLTFFMLHFAFFMLIPSEPRYFIYWRTTPVLALPMILGYLYGRQKSTQPLNQTR